MYGVTVDARHYSYGGDFMVMHNYSVGSKFLITKFVGLRQRYGFEAFILLA